MGLDYRIDAAYGFYRSGESADKLFQRLRLEGYYEGGPDYETLAELGYEDLGIVQRDDNSSEGDWAIFAQGTHTSIDPKYDKGSAESIGEREPSVEQIEVLTRLRDQLFPLEAEDRPQLGWFIMSSVW